MLVCRVSPVAHESVVLMFLWDLVPNLSILPLGTYNAAKTWF